MHKFDSRKKDKLDNPKRREVFPPLETLKHLGLKKGDQVADVGAGIGYFAFAAAQYLGETSKVYALDISKDMLNFMEEEAERLAINNIELIESREYDFKLPDKSVDFLLMVNVLHEVSDRGRFLNEANRLLKPGGTIALIDFDKVPTEDGPPYENRISQEEIKDLLEVSGFTLLKKKIVDSSFYIISGIKEKESL